MNTTLVVANWKSHKTTGDAKQWLYSFSLVYKKLDNVTIVLCVPFTIISYVYSFIQANDLPLLVGAQTISPFSQGAYTGAIAADQIAEFAKYVIIGHSERRQYFHESNEELELQVKQALAHKLLPVFCVQGVDTYIPSSISIVAFEPISAIGTGHPDTPENASSVANLIKTKYSHVVSVLYGGSVTGNDIAKFTNAPHINGVLVGGASLEADKFSELLINA